MGGHGVRELARRKPARGGAARPASMAKALAAAGLTLVLAAAMAVAVGPASATASGWHLQKTPDPPSRTGVLAADSCAAPDMCVAVGSYQPDGVFYAPLAEAWNGASWSVRKPPVPAGAQSTHLLGVSCVSASHCVAVGTSENAKGISSPLAEVWSGTSWSIQPTPMPTGGPVNALAAVSCTSVNACTAVGYTGNFGGSGFLLPLAEAWSGASWSIQPVSPSHATLTGVSCTSATACIAVGTADGFGPLAEGWNGTSWSLQHVPAPAGTIGGGLAGVSCPAASACTAVGDYQNRSGAHVLLAEAWNGTSWAISKAAIPAGATRSYLNGVSCPSAGSCTAVGSYQSGKRSHVPLAEAWNGTSWAIQRVPSPPVPRSGLSGVTCLSESMCTAVGSQTSRWLVPAPLAEAWNGASWSIETAPAAGTFTQAGLLGVACLVTADCFAVGSSGIDASTGALTERWDGSSWSIQRTPVPAGTQNYLGGVACTSATSCEAVGGRGTSHGARTLAEGWNGTSWSLQRAPSGPAPQGSYLTAVSCAPPDSCMAVGNAGSGTAVPLAEEWDGTSWSITTVPADGPGDSGLSGVSCITPSDCFGVGFGDNTTTGEVPLAERWDGSSWAVQPVPVPAGAVRGYLNSVSCVSAVACTAVGTWQNGSRKQLTLAEVWNGAGWSLQRTPSLGSGADVLTGVWCTSPGACTAVGGYQASGMPFTLAEFWDGTSWFVQPTADPSGAAGSGLAGVACSAPGECTAVGSTTTTVDDLGESATKALAEAEP